MNINNLNTRAFHNSIKTWRVNLLSLHFDLRPPFALRGGDRWENILLRNSSLRLDVLIHSDPDQKNLYLKFQKEDKIRFRKRQNLEFWPWYLVLINFDPESDPEKKTSAGTDLNNIPQCKKLMQTLNNA